MVSSPNSQGLPYSKLLPQKIKIIKQYFFFSKLLSDEGYDEDELGIWLNTDFETMLFLDSVDDLRGQSLHVTNPKYVKDENAFYILPDEMIEGEHFEFV